MEKRDYLLHSVKNAMKILRLFSLERPELGVTEIASILGLPKTTTHRLIATLTKTGFLDKAPTSNRYMPGLSLLGLSGVMTTNTEIQREAVPFLDKLANQFGEASHISVLEGNEIVYLHKVECTHPVRLLSHIGKRNPAYCTSSGKVLLAFQCAEVVNAVLETDFFPYGPNTITDKLVFRQHLHEIRKKGYDIAVDELHEGAVSLAVPVRDYTNEVVAAISIVGPKQRIQAEHYPYFIESLQSISRKLSEQLGYFKEKV
ncbi:IclR family transcriptional regulator [Brevibacillus choshinensis]|uniref:IclR family transcriptional regulator n=1 Tax=Brevibacillus choshinensis TaxID=54911 RepID=UPI002E221315|nr:IclR family transcriptional regulator [Brevibacillus choshinensis]MED4749777.1 IclR family transcriptional regulator [Brevibacillus choshinensis]MED4779950.1 IclR family transcriptional regulator [Brevibacillus choshinensis]